MKKEKVQLLGRIIEPPREVGWDSKFKTFKGSVSVELQLSGEKIKEKELEITAFRIVGCDFNKEEFSRLENKTRVFVEGEYENGKIKASFVAKQSVRGYENLQAIHTLRVTLRGGHND